MKLACFADLHGHVYQQFNSPSVYPSNTGSSRLDWVVYTLREIRAYCVSFGITHVLFSGDLFHIRAKVSTLAYNAVYDTLRTYFEQGITIIMVPGNHDQHDNSDYPQHSLHGLRDLPGIYVYDRLEVVDLPNSDENIKIVTAPYSKNARMIKDFLSGLTREQVGDNGILMFHLGIAGAFVGSASYPMSDAFSVDDLRPDLFKYAVGGHFHKRQLLGDHPHMFYCGSPLQHSFHDEGELKGFYVVDTARRWDVQFVHIDTPNFVIVDLDHAVHPILRSGHMPQAGLEDAMLHYAKNGDYVLARLRTEHVDKFKALATEVGLQHYKIELKREYVAQTRVDVKVGMTPEEVVVKWSDEYRPDAREIGLEILRKAQEGRV